MIRQPDYESRNVNRYFYESETRRIEKMNEVIGNIELTRAEEQTLVWLAGWEESTVNNLLSVIEKVARKWVSEVGGNAQDERVGHDISSVGK